MLQIQIAFIKLSFIWLECQSYNIHIVEGHTVSDLEPMPVLAVEQTKGQNSYLPICYREKAAQTKIFSISWMQNTSYVQK